MTTKNFADDLEQYIDKYGLDGVLDLISTVCALKAQHLRENWQDEKMARAWEKTMRLVDKFRVKLESEY